MPTYKNVKRLFSIILVLISYSEIVYAQDNFLHALKLNGQFYEYNPTIKIDSINKYTLDSNHTIRKFTYFPSYMYRTKKKNWREIQVAGYFNNSDKYVKPINNPLDSLYYRGNKFNYFNFFFNSITHVDLLKKRNTKLKIFFSSNSRLGIEKSKYVPYTRLTYFQTANIGSLNLGLSTRIGYNFSKRIYLELNPSILMETTLRIGNQYLENPLTPINLRKQPIFDLDSVLILPFKGYSFRNLSFSVAYRF